MGTEERVVAVVPMDNLVRTDKSAYATRVRALGLTAYGKNLEETNKKARQMFAAYVVVRRKLGTLRESLDASGLDWCWESEFDGDASLVSPDGDEEILHCNRKKELSWHNIGALVVA